MLCHVGKFPGIYRVPTRFLASPVLLEPLSVKMSWYTLQNLKFLFPWLPCGSLYSPSGVLCNQIWTLQAQDVSGARGSGGGRSEGSWEANIQSIFIPRLDPKGLCALRNYPSRASLFPESKTTGQFGPMCLHLPGVCPIVTVTLNHGASATVLWVTTV